MTQARFNEIVAEQLDLCLDLLHGKAPEYTSGGDRLSCFKAAAALQSNTPAQALGGMMAKHIISIFELIDAERVPVETWNEKISDAINYLLLLKAVVLESSL